MKFSDEEIIKKVTKGNTDAYKLIVDRYADSILNFCFRYLYCKEEAEDATQDVFIKAYQALYSWEPKAQFKTWLYRIAMNHCLNIVRRRKRVSFMPLDANPSGSEKSYNPEPPDMDLNAEFNMIENQERQYVRNAVNQLPENQKQVIILYHFQDLSYKEIAEVLNVSISSVESRLFRAKKTLAKILRNEKK